MFIVHESLHIGYETHDMSGSVQRSILRWEKCHCIDITEHNWIWISIPMWSSPSSPLVLVCPSLPLCVNAASSVFVWPVLHPGLHDWEEVVWLRLYQSGETWSCSASSWIHTLRLSVACLSMLGEEPLFCHSYWGFFLCLYLNRGCLVLYRL